MKAHFNSFLIYFFFFIFTITYKSSKAQDLNSSYGKVFTPKGSLRALIIYVGFEGFEENQEQADWKNNQDFPNWNHEELFFTDVNQFTSSLNEHTSSNISRFYHEMSQPKGNFKFMVDIFPKRVNIDVTNANSFATCNRLVMEKIKKEHPNFDWSRYDQRTNAPNFRFDNSKTGPDKKPDYVIIAYKYRLDWQRQPKQGMNQWTTTYSILDGLYGFEMNGYTFDGSGFTMGFFDCRKTLFLDLFVHEVAHELFSCPHYSGANSAMGRYFYFPTGGSDMMSSWRGQIASAFERWLLGWMDIKNDLSSLRHNGTYVLKDYVTSGEAIRIKIPHTEEQFFWIENRQGKSTFDRNVWRGQMYNQPLGGKGIADRDKGLYIYQEEVLSDRKKISTALVYDLEKVNGIMPLNARGNFDYPKPKKLTHTNGSYPSEKQVNWNNPTYWFEQAAPNPVSGINPYVMYRNDMDSSGIINTEVGRNGAFNGMGNTESFLMAIEKVKDTFLLTYAYVGGQNESVKDRHPDTFIPNDEIGISFNPMLLNRPKYMVEKDSILPYYTNGLYIKVLSQRRDKIRLKIKFNQTELVKDARWCGNIVCKPVPKAKHGFALDIKPNIQLHIDKSGTVNNGHKKHLDFISPTSVVLDSGTVFHLSKAARIKLSHGSKLIVKKGAKIILEKEAKIEVSDDSILEIQDPSSIVRKD